MKVNKACLLRCKWTEFKLALPDLGFTVNIKLEYEVSVYFVKSVFNFVLIIVSTKL